MKKVICIFLCVILLLVFLIGIYVLVIYIKDTCAIKNDPTLYNGFKIIEQKTVTAEDGVEFFTVQVDMNNPKIPYRLYVFTSNNKEKHLCFVDSYMHRFNPEVKLITSSGNESYYVIGGKNEIYK